MRQQITPTTARTLRQITRLLCKTHKEAASELDQAITRAMHGKADSKDMGRIARAISVYEQLHP